MKKVICKVEYDTEASELVAKHTVGAFGDPTGYEERLYKTEGGKFFLYTVGGAQSPYTEEGIKRMSAAKADEWLAQNKYFRHSKEAPPQGGCSFCCITKREKGFLPSLPKSSMLRLLTCRSTA